MQNFLTHIRSNIIRGFIAIIPLLLCVIAIELLYHFIDKKIVTFINQFIDVSAIPGLGIIILLLILMMIGYLVTNVLGQRLFKMLDSLIMSIPFIREVYILARQISDILSKEGGDAYKKTVLINHPNVGQWSVGFLSGRVYDDNVGKDMFKVYVPMAHPAIGVVYVVEEKSIIDPGWSVQDGFKMVLTLGLVTPKFR